MRIRLAFSALAAVLAAVPAQSVSGQAAAAERQLDWSAVVDRTPEGGFRMGNPEAPLKLVEYLSLTCPHCAVFSAEAMPGLVRDHVATGRVSIEYRNYVLNHYDLAEAVLSRCASPQDYFRLTTRLFERQLDLGGRIDSLTPAQRAEIEVRPTPASVARTAELLGLKPIAEAYGISAAEADRCLADPAGLNRLFEIRDQAEALGIEGTPAFILNGQLITHTNTWAGIEPLLRGAR